MTRIPRALVATHRFLWRHGFVPAVKDIRLNRWLKYADFWRRRHHYSQLPGAEPLNILDTFPQLADDTAGTAVESHYFYQSVWLGHHLAARQPSVHVDVGSDHRLVGMLTSLTRVVFVEIRPLQATVPRLLPLTASITRLPICDRSVNSLSCLHVVEHVGLGRYGDLMDPRGTVSAAAELSRVLASGGILYLSTPVGRARVEFNAHRVHEPKRIIAMFPELELQEFSVEDDAGHFIRNADPRKFDDQFYACGMFRFRRPTDT